jgi:hypothetical protein
VFVAVTLVALLISLNFLYKAGKITSEKMRLQNAADATAYSVSLIEARDLNFAAYINRAMIANEVAIGQLVGMHSWTWHFSSFGNYIEAYSRQFISPIFPPVTEPIHSGITAVTTTWKSIGQAFATGAKVLAQFGTVVLHNVNTAYGYAQQAFHFASILYAISAIDEMISQNAPGAKLSDYGILSLLGHAATYGAIPSLPGSFVKTYRSTSPSGATPPPDSGEPEETDNQVGMQRFAGMVRHSRDDWTMMRGWRLPLYIPPILPIDIHEHIEFGFDAVVFSVNFSMDIDFELNFSLDRFGGSELRFKGDPDGKKFGWSAADTTGLSVHFLFAVYAKLEACLLGICADIGVGGEASLSGGYLDLELRAELLGEEIEFTVIPHVPFPTSAPFASGSSQVGNTTSGNFLDTTNLSKYIPGENQFEPDDYGRAHQHVGAWELGVPFPPSSLDTLPAPNVPVVALTMPTVQHKPATTYKGLPSYLDTDDPGTPLWGFMAPYLIIGLVKDFDEVYSPDSPRMTGSLALTDRPADDEIGAIAKSEVYFKRPTDFDLFARADGLEEYGSAFNPYWNARLVETTHADRMVSMWIQQKENFYDPSAILPVSLPSWGDILSWLP